MNILNDEIELKKKLEIKSKAIQTIRQRRSKSKLERETRE